MKIYTAIILLILPFMAYGQGPGPVKPHRLLSDLHLDENYSTINLPVKVSVSRLRQLISEALPRTVNGEGSANVGGNIHNERITYSVSRSSLDLQGNNGVLTLSTNLSGQASFKAEACPLGTGFGCSDVSETADIRANVTVQISNMQLLEDWNIKANVDINVDVNHAQIQLFNIVDVSIRGKVTDAINDAITRLKGNLMAQLNSELMLKSKVERLWSKVPQLQKINDYPLAWLMINPVGLSLGNIEIDRGDIIAPVQVIARIESVVGQRPAVSRSPLPTLMSHKPFQGISLYVPVLIDIDEVEKHLNDCCSPLSLKVANYNANFSDFRVKENSGSLIIKSQYSISGDVESEGLVKMSGKLGVDNNSELTFQDVNLDFESTDLSADILNLFLKPIALKTLERKLDTSLVKFMIEAEEHANALLDEVEQNSDLEFSAHVDALKIADVQSTRDSMLLWMEMRGSAGVSLDSL